MGDGHKYINNSVMIRQSGSCGVRIQKEPGNIPLPVSAQGLKEDVVKALT
jgi:hypothetical protein